MEAGVGAQRARTRSRRLTPALPERALTLALLRDYVTLTKPRIISLLLLTTVATMFVADPSGPAIGTILWTMLGGYLAAGGAGAINHYLDRERDAGMTRTRSRPLVSGRIPGIDQRHCSGRGRNATVFALGRRHHPVAPVLGDVGHPIAGEVDRGCIPRCPRGGSASLLRARGCRSGERHSDCNDEHHRSSG